MGYIVRRCMYAGAGENVKAKLISAISRYIEILKTTAKVSLNIELNGKVKIDLIKEKGYPRYYEKEGIDEEVFKELLNSKSFKIEFDVLNIENVKKGFPSHVLFWYDEEKNLENSINVDFVTSYPEGILSLNFLGLIGVANIVKLSGFRNIAESQNKRLQELWESLMRIAFGSFSKTERTFQLRKYEPDTFVVNLFGKIVKIKPKE